MSLAKSLELPISWLHGDPDSRPFASYESLWYMATLYLVSVTIGTKIMKGRELDVTFLSVPHNFLMAAYSLYSFIGTIDILITNWATVGFDAFTLLCDPKHVLMQNMDYWMYLFYLSKYFEFFDTLFLVLKGKQMMPPANSQFFLHIFHHTTTASIVWVSWKWHFSVAYLGPLTNAFVHTFMYGYYFLAELKLINRAWGGKYITPLQLIQFVICLVSGIYESFHMKECDTDVRCAYWLWFLYLVFFIFFLKIFFDKKGERNSSTREPRGNSPTSPSTHKPPTKKVD